MKRKCDECSSTVLKITEFNTTSNVVDILKCDNIDIGQQNKEIRPVIKMAEPVLLNPNSYANMKVILSEVKKFADVGVNREWVFIGCDGPPYCLSERICESDQQQFDFVSMVPGLGHLHMNQLKTLFKILDDIILELLGKDVLNFVSPKAYSFFVDAKDTHKSWQALKTFLFGTTMELIHEFRQSSTHEEINDPEPEPTKFLAWLANQTNPTIKLIAELVLNFSLAIYLFKLGVRANDVQLINAGRFKFADLLFYAFKHPIYREVEYRDLRNRVMYPPEIRKLRDDHSSFSTTSVPFKSQGGDFVLEGRVKRQKLIAPKGPIQGKTWQMLSRALDSFDTIYDSVSSTLNLKDPEFQRNINLSDEIYTWRAVLRKSCFLSKENFGNFPENAFGEQLSIDCVDITEKARACRKDCWSKVANGESIVTTKTRYLNILDDRDIDDLLYVPEPEELDS